MKIEATSKDFFEESKRYAAGNENNNTIVLPFQEEDQRNNSNCYTGNEALQLRMKGKDCERSKRRKYNGRE